METIFLKSYCLLQANHRERCPCIICPFVGGIAQNAYPASDCRVEETLSPLHHSYRWRCHPCTGLQLPLQGKYTRSLRSRFTSFPIRLHHHATLDASATTRLTSSKTDILQRPSAAHLPPLVSPQRYCQSPYSVL